MTCNNKCFEQILKQILLMVLSRVYSGLSPVFRNSLTNLVDDVVELVEGLDPLIESTEGCRRPAERDDARRTVDLQKCTFLGLFENSCVFGMFDFFPKANLPGGAFLNCDFAHKILGVLEKNIS